MSAQTPFRAPMPTLRELVKRYRILAGGFGKPAPLSAFGFSQIEVEHIFSSYDEDYHISRFFHFSEIKGGQSYSISGEPATHVAIDREIESIL